MKIPKITDGELRVLEVLWEQGPLAAKEIVKCLKERVGWNRNTTYTFINRLVEKEVVERQEPGFICIPRYSKEEVQVSETQSFLDKMYEGSLKMLLTSFINHQRISKGELEELKKMIDESHRK